MTHPKTPRTPRPPTLAERVTALELQVQALTAQLAAVGQGQASTNATVFDVERRVRVLEAAQPFQVTG